MKKLQQIQFQSKYTRQEITEKGLELVAYAGDARSDLLLALDFAKNNDFEKANDLIKKANESITLAHRSQTELLSIEASGEYSDLTFIMVHGQDHLMTTLLLSQIIQTLIDVYRKEK